MAIGQKLTLTLYDESRSKFLSETINSILIIPKPGKPEKKSRSIEANELEMILTSPNAQEYVLCMENYGLDKISAEFWTRQVAPKCSNSVTPYLHYPPPPLGARRVSSTRGDVFRMSFVCFRRRPPALACWSMGCGGVLEQYPHNHWGPPSKM